MNQETQNLIHTAACLSRDCATLIRILCELEEVRIMARQGTIGTGAVYDMESTLARLRRQIPNNARLLLDDKGTTI